MRTVYNEFMKKSSVSLTEGPIARLILSFALPILAGQVFQNLYHSVDAIVVGKLVGTTALAAVTSSTDITNMLIGFFSGLSVGAGVLFARYFGAEDYGKLRDSIHTALAFAVLLGVLMASLGIALTNPILRLVACPDDVFPEAAGYLRIYFVGILFTSIYNVGSGILRAVGDSKDPFLYIVVASLTNIVLDVVFVAWLRLGVNGVAYATIIAQLCSNVLLYRRLFRADDVYRIAIRDLRIHKEHLKEIIRLGLPTALQTSLISVSNLFVQRYVNEFGSSVMAGVGAAKKIDKFIGLIPQSIALASMTFVSQNLGAKKPERAFRGIRTALGLSILFVVGPGILLYVFARPVSTIFTDDPAALGYAVGMLRAMAFFFFFQALNQNFMSASRGFGHSRAVMWLSMGGMIVMRQIYLAVSMHISHTVTNIYFAFPVGWAFSAVFVIVYFYFAIYRPYRQKTL